jgi:hypothetical protein
MLPGCIKIGYRRLSAGTTETLFRLSDHCAYISNTESCKYEISANYSVMSFADNIFQIPWTCFYMKKGPETGGGGLQHISGRIGCGVHIICYVVGNTAHSKCHPSFDSFLFHIPCMQPQSAV